MGTGRNVFRVCHVRRQVAGHSRGKNHELFVKRLENYLMIIKRYITRNYYYYYYYYRTYCYFFLFIYFILSLNLSYLCFFTFCLSSSFSSSSSGTVQNFLGV